LIEIKIKEQKSMFERRRKHFKVKLKRESKQESKKMQKLSLKEKFLSNKESCNYFAFNESTLTHSL